MGFFNFDKRPLFLAGIGACLGVYTATGESTYMVLVLIPAVILVSFLGGTSPKHMVWFAAAFIFFAANGLMASYAYDRAYEDMDGTECSVIGRITSVDSIKEKYTLVTVNPAGILNRKIRVYLFDNDTAYIQGDGISLQGKLRKPYPATNPGGYDSRKMLYCDGIAATVFCYNGNYRFIDSPSPGHLFGLARKDILERCSELLGGEKGGMVAAMLIGDKTTLGQDVSDDFRNSGLSHTMAVSGSHVAYILLPMYFIFSRLGVARRKYYPFLIILLVLFAVLAGMQPSVMRAGITAVIMLAGGMLDRNPDGLNSLAASALILLLFNPFSLYDAGFILSYASVVSILVLYRPVSEFLGKGFWGNAVSMGIAVQIGILPVTMKLFFSIQTFAVFSNIAVFPVRAVLAVSGWAMYLLSCISMPIGQMLSVPVGFLSGMMAYAADLFANTGVSVVNVPYVHPLFVLSYYFLVWYLFFGPSLRAAVLSLGTVLTAVCLILSAPGDVWVFLDSGKADCFVIKTGDGRDFLVDTGEYMQGNSIAYYTGDRIDAIFLSHAHDDHIGGLYDILHRFVVGKVFIPGCPGNQMDSVIECCREAGVECIALTAGDSVTIGNCEIDVAGPSYIEYNSLNDTSMVIKLTQGGGTLLLCGDAEIYAQSVILGTGFDVRADVLKVPHHGASNAADAGFLEAVDPLIAVISSGPDDPLHPSEETIGMLLGCDVYRSDMNGAVIIRPSKEGYKVETYRK